METDFTETRLVKEIERICIVALTSIFLGGERLHPPLQLTYLHPPPPPQTNVLKITKILNYTGLSQIHLTVIHLKAMVFKKNICFFLNAPKPGIITDSRHNFPHSASTINRSVMSKLHPRNCFPTPPKNIYLSRIVFSIFLNSFNYIYKLIQYFHKFLELFCPLDGWRLLDLLLVSICPPPPFLPYPSFFFLQPSSYSFGRLKINT